VLGTSHEGPRDPADGDRGDLGEQQRLHLRERSHTVRCGARERRRHVPRWLRIGLGSVAVLALAGAGLWSWLDASEPVPEQTSYRIDLDELHRLAASLPGPKPRAIRSLRVSDAALPRGVIFAGEPFRAAAACTRSSSWSGTTASR
jgi:hypothetical protein